MITVYDVGVDSKAVSTNLHRLVNQTYKLLPLREEGLDWKLPLQTVIIELLGMFTLLPDLNAGLKVVCKLEGLKVLQEDICFEEYRRVVFECCSLLNQLEQTV